MSHKIPRVQIDRTIYETWSHRTRHIYICGWQRQSKRTHDYENDKNNNNSNSNEKHNNDNNIEIVKEYQIHSETFETKLRFTPTFSKNKDSSPKDIWHCSSYSLYFFLQISFSEGTEPPSAFRYIISVNFGTFSKLKNKTKIFAYAYSSFLPPPTSIPFQSSAF